MIGRGARGCDLQFVGFGAVGVSGTERAPGALRLDEGGSSTESAHLMISKMGDRVTAALNLDVLLPLIKQPALVNRGNSLEPRSAPIDRRSRLPFRRDLPSVGLPVAAVACSYLPPPHGGSG